MKKSIYLAIFLAWISALAGGFLAVANYVTAPVIAVNAAKAEAENLIKIFPNGEQFAAVTYSPEKGNPILSIYSAGESGFAYKVSIQGYSNPIVYIVGIDKAGTFVGYEVLALADSPGIGTRVGEDEFRTRVVGKELSGKVDALSGATVSSSAVIRGLEAVRTHFSANLK